MKVVVTGANGFLGWHLRCRLLAQGQHDVIPVTRDNYNQLIHACAGADAVIHLAGINRAPDDELIAGNIALATDLVQSLNTSNPTARIVFANSVQSGNGTPYGTGKAQASNTFESFAAEHGTDYVDVLLPNLFGEHGRPGYNSFVATFCHEVASGLEPQVNDNRVNLLHAQDAAQCLIDALAGPSRVERPAGDPHGVIEVLDLLKDFHSVYQHGEFPTLDSRFKIDLFNTYRAAAFPSGTPIPFSKHSDTRGSFVETVKVHGGGGQTAFSTTVPGITRGEHFHLNKVERFVVIGGQARISLRKLFSEDVISFDVTGDEPVAIDMPTMWAHNITNTGADELLTLFWTESVFDPDHPDTYPEAVALVSSNTKGNA